MQRIKKMPDTYGIPTYEEFKSGIQFDIEKGKCMKLNYNKDEASKASSVQRKPGTYSFVIADAQPKTAKTGTEGIALKLDLDVDGQTMRAFDNLWLSEKALFRLKDLCDSCKTTLPDDTDDLIGAVGKVKVTVNDDGYYEVVKYVVETTSEGSNYDDTRAVADW